MSRIPLIGSLFFFLLISPALLFCQKRNVTHDQGADIQTYDTINFRKGIYFTGPTRYYDFQHDTTIVIASYRKLRPEEINTLRSNTFYDSLYQKLGKNRLSKLLYNLAFVAPIVSTLPDSIQTQKIEIPFLPFQGMYIRDVNIKTLSPFGTSIFDTAGITQTGAGKFGNKVHINTHASIIRNQLMFKSGQCVNADKIADNMRILKDLSYVADARIVLTETYPGSDTVDILVIVKDKWSIGGNLTIVNLGKYHGSLYDANFLGSGDRFSVFWSINYTRAPFFRFDGISYCFTNIMGSFIDGEISLSQDDDGNETMYAGLSRPFYSYLTKVAGGINFTLAKTVSPISDTVTEVATYHQEGAWIGLSYPVSSSVPSTRIVFAQSLLYRYYFNRPVVLIDSNIGYYNTTNLLTSIQVSRNKYYNTDYILQFGMTESFPYGFLGQITTGPSITDFYTRLYMNVGVSVGNFIKKFGYLYGRFNLGGYLNRDHFEDGLLKVESLYMSYLYFSSSKRFRFRSYLSCRYHYQFRERDNNRDYYDLSQAARIKSVDVDSIFRGNQVALLSFSTVAYSPWYFYGFRFAMQATVWAGLSSPQERSLWSSRLMTGIGVGILFKNDNLIFPTLMVSCFVYPTTPGVPFIQFELYETSSIGMRDFSPTAPYIQTMSN